MLALMGTCPAMTVGWTSVHRDFRSRCRKAMHAEHADDPIRFHRPWATRLISRRGLPDEILILPTAMSL
jgi:hypothetical protein